MVFSCGMEVETARHGNLTLMIRGYLDADDSHQRHE